MADYFRVRNFERFQHYKDRNPPWIRLYGALWRDRAFFRLADAAKAHLIGLFSLAARLDNRIPDDPQWLAHELCASEEIDLAGLEAAGFLVREPDDSAAHPEIAAVASRSVSASEQSQSELTLLASPNPTPTETSPQIQFELDHQPSPDGDTGTRLRREPGMPRIPRRETPWPSGFALSHSMRLFALRLNLDPDAEFESWRDDCAAHGRRYADWNAAWRGRCRNALRFGRGRAGPAAGGSATVEIALRRLREATDRAALREAS